MPTGAEIFRSSPWYKKLAIILLAPIVIPIGAVFALLLLGGLGIFAVVFNFIQELRFGRKMRRLGRFLSSRIARQRVPFERGTLIVEAPSLGWNFVRAWWTPDDIPALSPFTYPTKDEYRAAAQTWTCTDWDRWCFENYLSPERGTALLLRVWKGRKLEEQLKRQFPDVNVVRSWSALAHPVLGAKILANDPVSSKSEAAKISTSADSPQSN